MNLEILANRLITKTAATVNSKHENNLEIISETTMKAKQQKARMLPQQIQ